MGALLKSLSPVSSYAAKKSGLWPDLMAQLEECVLPQDVDAFERRIVELGLAIPAAWQEPLAEIIKKKREEIQEEDLTLIMRDRYDF